MTKGDRIKKLREDNNVSQTDLAEKIGISKQNLYKYENNIITNIPSDKVELIANYFGVSPAYIMGWDMLISAHPLPQAYTCKYYHSVSAGIGATVDGNCDTYSYFFHSQAQADHCFAVDIEGDSMLPELHDGDVAIVDTEAEPQNGDIVVFFDKAEDLGYIKQYHKTGDIVMFISFNTAYQPITYPLSALGDRVKIWGRVIKSLRDF